MLQIFYAYWCQSNARLHSHGARTVDRTFLWDVMQLSRRSHYQEWIWCCQTFHKISWQLERLSIGLVVLCAVAAVAWSPSAARSLSWSATVRTSCAAVCGLVCSHNDCQQYRIIFVDADTVWVIFTCSLASYSLTLINSFPMATFGVTSYRVNSNYILG